MEEKCDLGSLTSLLYILYSLFGILHSHTFYIFTLISPFPSERVVPSLSRHKLTPPPQFLSSVLKLKVLISVLYLDFLYIFSKSSLNYLLKKSGIYFESCLVLYAFRFLIFSICILFYISVFVAPNWKEFAGADSAQ